MNTMLKHSPLLAALATAPLALAEVPVFPDRVLSIDVVISKSNPVQVAAFVTGTQTVACVGLEEPVVARKDSAFTVVLAETVMAPGTVCNSLLAVTGFQRQIELPVAGLPAGSYTIAVNGKLASFSL